MKTSVTIHCESETEAQHVLAKSKGHTAQFIIRSFFKKIQDGVEGGALRSVGMTNDHIRTFAKVVRTAAAEVEKELGVE